MGDMDDDIKKFQKEMNKFFDRLLGPESKKFIDDLKRGLDLREPLYDIEETENELIASLELPGIDKKDIQLGINENSLEIKVEKKAEAVMEKKGRVRAERHYRGLYRTISLPIPIIPDKSKASYKNGILEVVMPKAERGRSKKLNIE